MSLWTASTHKDEFTDRVTKMVTIVGAGGIYSVGKYYPLVGLDGTNIVVGVRSGGSYRMPVGTVQIRVDENPAWTISPDETPVYLSPALPQTTGVDTNLQSGMMSSMTKIMSPFTATTGDKAHQILTQMIHGKIVRYRTVGLNAAASTTGEVKIDQSFFSALKEIGIDPSNF